MFTIGLLDNESTIQWIKDNSHTFKNNQDAVIAIWLHSDPNESELTYWMFSYDFKSKNKAWSPEDKNFLKRKRKRNALVFALYINVFLIFLTFNSFIAHLLDVIVEFQKFSYPV